MTVSMWIPLEDYLTGWAENLFPKPDLGGLAVTGHSTRVTDGIGTSVLQLQLDQELILALPGIDVITAQLLSAGLTVEVDWTGPFRVRVLDLGGDLVIASPLLVHVTSTPSGWVPDLQPDGSPTPFHVTFTVGVVELDGFGGLTFSPDLTLSVPPFMLGDTGFVVEVTGVTLSFSGEQPPPDTAVEGFRGLLFDSAVLHFPDGLDVPNAPESFEVVDGAIGTGGFSGAFTGSWDTQWEGATPAGDGAGSLLGFAFGLESLQLQVQQDAVTGAAIVGGLAVPFFDQVLTVAVSVDDAGTFSATVTGTPDSPPQLGYGSPVTPTTPAIVTLTVPGVGTLRVDGLGLVRDDDGTGLLLSGELDLQVGAPALSWPTIELQDLRIAPDGTVHVPGGWIDLQQPIVLDLYGFTMEITRIGFGTEDDGRRWVGLDGAVRLTELLPAGASVRGLRVSWDPAHPGIPQLTLDGLSVGFAVPGAVDFGGEVALADDPDSGAKLFTGALRLSLDALDIGIDAGITIGHDGADVYVFVHLGVDLPIPLGATGAALYGLDGLLALEMAPKVAGGDWYGWYTQVSPPYSTTKPDKWGPEPGTWAVGAGVSIGTLPDAGFSVNTRALLIAVLPGPVLLLQGSADLFKLPPALGGASQEGTLGMLAALDGRASTLQLGIDAAWSLPEVIGIAAATEAFFDFDRPGAWHLWIGRDTPATARIRADILSLFHADAWLMLGAGGVDTGLKVAWGDRWVYGPARIELDGWIGGTATLTRHPAQLSGTLDLGGRASVGVGPFGIGLGVHARLSGRSPTPYEVSGRIGVTVELPPPLHDLDVDLDLSWRQPAVPQVDDPWVGAVLEHPLCTESWALAEDAGADVPVVPLDAGLLLTFAQPMGDETPIADNPPAPSPTTGIGDYVAGYALTGLRLSRRRRSEPDTGWQDVTGTLSGTWTPDAGEVGSRLQLMARSPFAFTRSGSRRWVDGFLADHPDWPCQPEPPLEPTCLTWTGRPLDAVMPALWEQDGAVLSTDAQLVVTSAGPGHVLRLGAAERDGQRLPGRLWVTLPEPAAEVTALVNVFPGIMVLMQGWAGGTAVADDTVLNGAGLLRVSGDALDAVTLDWGFGQEAELAALCWIPASATAARAAWGDRASRLAAAAQRWSDVQPLLEPDCHYRLEVTSRARLAADGATVQETEVTHAVRFRTAGPPGIPPDWLAPPAPPATAFPFGGALADLSRYVSRTVPDPGAAPVFAAYDLGCTFAGSAVPQLYGGDLRLRVTGDDGNPVRDGSGAEITLDLGWQQAPTATLSGPDVAWLDRLASCTGLPEPGGLPGDDVLGAAVPPAVALPPHRALTARLEATRPLFTDPFTDLLAFDQQVLTTGAAVTTCTAAGGSATIARPRSRPDSVVALAGDPLTARLTVSATARPGGPGTFGLVIGHGGPDHWLALELTAGGGRRLVQVSPAGPLSVERVLWQDDGAVSSGVAYALTLIGTGDTVTAGIDDFEVTVPAAAGPGRFGLLSGIAAPDGCEVSDLVVRSAPSAVVYSWRFTTSAYPGLPELLATFTGRVWPAGGAVDAAALAAADAQAAQLAAAQADVDLARSALADAVAAGRAGDLDALTGDALEAVDRRDAVAAQAYQELSAALGLGYRPAPPVAEVLTASAGGSVVALVLDLPEPLPWERMTWALTRTGPHPARPLSDVTLAWSEDGAHATLTRSGGSPFPSGDWSLSLELALDAGAERAVWSRAGDSAPETASLRFRLT
jgi:hypothetical protein